MITKKNLLERIEELKLQYQNISNFDELYNKIMDSYQNSKSLINEQIIEYDKKIVQNNSNVESRLDDFKIKVDKAIDETFVNNVKWLNEQKQSFETYVQSTNETLLDVSNKLNESLNDQFNMKESEIEKKLNHTFNEHNNSWISKMAEVNNDITTALSKLEIDINEIVMNNVSIKLNQIIIDEISKNASDNILNSFNKTLVELKQPEADSIIDAIRGMLNKQLGVKIKEETSLILKPIDENDIFHESFSKLKTVIESSSGMTRIVPMIVGPAGTGKSTAVEQIARKMNLHFYMANRIQNTFELLGFVDAAGNYITTQFYEAFTKGGLFLFDEVDASSPEALVTINAAISQGYMAFPGHPAAIHMHPDFKVVCAGNTFGTGSTLQYTGRNKLDAATLDRFMIIEWGYDEELEKKLIKDKDLLKVCWELRNVSSKIDQTIIVSTRGILTLEKVLEQNKITNAFKTEDIFKHKFFETTKKEHLKKIIEAVGQKMNKNPYFIHLELLS